MPIRLTPVDYNPFPRVNLTPVDFNPFDVAEIARRQNAAGTAPPPDPRDVAAQARVDERNRGIEPAPQRTPQDAQRLNRIGAGREQVGDREALAIEQQAPSRQRELADNTDAANPDVRNTMAYIGTRLHQLNPQQYPWLFRNGAPLAAPEIADLISRSSDEIAGMSPQDATNYLFGRPEMRPANAAASLGQRSAPPRIQDPLLRNQTRGPDGSYQEYSGWDDSLRGLSNGDVRPDRTADLIAEQVTGNLGAAGKVAALIHTAVTGGAPGSGSYIWGQARSGLHSFLAATGQLIDDIQPFTTSDEDLAVLYRNDPQGLAEQRAGAVGALTRFIRDQQSSAVTSAQDISPQARLNYGNRTYATLDQAHAAWASPVRLLGDALQALPTSAALLLTTIATRGVSSEVESAALARGATAEAARAEGTAAAIRVATRVGAASEGAIGGAQQQVQTQNAIEAQPQRYFDASPQYRELISQGYDPAAARLYIAARAGRESGVGAGITDAVTNLASGPILGRIIGEGGPLAGRIARGFATEGTQEAVQSGGEQFSQNLATKQEADPNQSLVDGVLENVLQGFFVGGLMGGATGGTFGHAEHRPGEIPTPTSAPGVPPGIREAAAAAPPNITPEDQASPLPTELIAQGKKAAADALATTQADQLVGDNIGHGIGDHVAVTIGGQTRTGQIHDAFTEEDPETGTHHGAVIGWSDGTTTRERFSDLHDAGAQIRRTPLNEGDQPGRFAIAGGYTVGDGYGANRGDHVHHGVDMFARAGTPFPVGRPFDIVESHRQTSHGGIGGNVATVQFEDGSEWIAAHLPDLPRAGHYEAGADVIRAGNTGSASATESHVHWQPVNELAHTIYNQGRRTVAAYLTGGAAPAGAVAGAETDAAGPAPDFSWIDRPVDQAGAPAAEAAAPAAAATEGDRGPAIGAATAAIDNHEANAPALQGSRRIGEDQTYTFGDGGSETRRYLHGSDGRVWRLSVDHETGDLTERMLVENPKTGDEYFTRNYRGGAEQPIQARPHQLQTYVAIDMSGNQAAPTGDGTRAAPITATTAEHVDQAAANAVQPTEGQAEAGNYQKGHVRVQGLDITIETPKGAERTGTAPDGTPWSVTMPDHYGYVKRTTGADAEQVDVYVGPQPESPRVFVVDQNDHQTGQFDEHKAMLGYPSEDAARAAYHDAFSDGKGPDRVGAITEMSVPQFKEWLGSEQTTPAATAQLSDITGQQGSGGVTESVTPQPSADIGQFDPEPHVEAMRQYVANSTGSLNDTEKMGKALGLTSEQTHRVMGALAARKDSGIRMTKGRPAGVRRILVSPAVTELRGSKQVTVKAARYKTVTYRPAVPARFQRIGTRQAPLHFLEWVRAQGGVRSDRHDLRNVGALARHPGVINNRSGLSLDQLGERMPEAGWSTERPTESDVLDMLRLGSTAKVYRPEDSHALTDQGGAERAKAQADEGTLRALADEFGQKLDEAGFSRALEYLSQGKTPIQAITEAANDAGVDAVEALATETSDDTYVEIAEEAHGQSDATAAGQDDRNPSQGIAGPEGEQGDAGGSGQANAESTGAEKAPAEVATDLLGKPAEQPAPKAEAPTEPQPDMLGTQPGDERRALERKGEGRIQSSATQKAPGSEGGLFDQRDTTGDLTAAQPTQPESPPLDYDTLKAQGLALAGDTADPNAFAVGYANGRQGQRIVAMANRMSRGPRNSYFDGNDLGEKAKNDPALATEHAATVTQSPVEQAKAALQSALDALNGKTAEAPVAEAAPAESTPATEVAPETPVAANDEAPPPAEETAAEQRTSPNEGAATGQTPPLTEEDAKAIVGELERVLTKMDPNNRFTFKAAKGLLDFLPADAQGAYLNRVAYVSLDRSYNPVSTIIHEIGGHGFRALGLYTSPEWTALGKDANERGYMDWAKRHYPTAPTAKQEEEAISEMIATFVSRRNETKGFVRTALQKVGDFVDALIDAIRTWRTGNPQARQIMRQIESGKIGARPAGFGLEGAPRAAVNEATAMFQKVPQSRLKRNAFPDNGIETTYLTERTGGPVIPRGMNIGDYDLFARKVMLDELSAADPETLPYGFNAETLAAAQVKIDKLVNSVESVREAVRKYHFAQMLGEMASEASPETFTAPSQREPIEGEPPRAANIRMDKLESTQDIQTALEVSAEKLGDFKDARRGVVTHEETQALADDLDMTVEQLTSRRRGQAFNAHELLASRQLLVASANDLVEKARQAEGGSDADLLAFRKSWVRHVAIQEQVSGMTAEAGRALNQFKLISKAGGDLNARMMREIINTEGGRGDVESAAKAILGFSDDPAKMNRFARDAYNPTWRDKLFELWINGLLSGPATHVVNAVSNAITAVTQIPEFALAAGIGKVRSLSKPETDRILRSEVGARAIGMIQGAKEGARLAAEALRTGEGSDVLSKLEARTQRAISGKKGEIVRIPGRLLIVGDELFKGMARRMELEAQAARTATKEGLTGDEYQARTAALVAEPTQEMVDKAMDYARYSTFQRPLGEMGQAITHVINKIPGMRLIVPFIRTPANIFKFAIERTPAAPILKEVRADLKAGGTRRDLAVSRIVIGSALGATVMLLAAAGIVTGGDPDDDNARRLLHANGWQPYSIKIGDTYYSYSRLDPLSTIIGLAADLAMTHENMSAQERDGAYGNLFMAMLNQLKNKTFLSGIGNLIEAIEDPGRFGPAFIGRLAGTVVPAGIAQLNNAYIDPVQRDARSVLERVESRVPGLSRNLPPRRDIWGRVVTRDGGVGPDIASPIAASTDEHDPITEELTRAGVHLDIPSRRVAGIEITAAQYDRYQELSGEVLHRMAGRMVQSQRWQRLNEDDRVELFDRLKNHVRREVRDHLGLTKHRLEREQAIRASGGSPS